MDFTTGSPRSDVVVGYTSIHKANNKKKLCHCITPEPEGFRRPNWAQIEAKLCVSDLDGLGSGFDYRVAQKRCSRGLH